MTIFIADPTLPQQPAFIFATYPAGMTVAADPLNSNYDPASVLSADEASGYCFGAIGTDNALAITFLTPFDTDCVAMTGIGIAGATLEISGSNDGFILEEVPIMSATPISGDTFYLRHDHVSFAGYKYKFSGLTTKSIIKHIAPCILAPLPFLEDGACINPIQSDGEHLISHAGLFLGSVTDKVMKPFSLSFGQVDAVEEVLFSNMVNSCVKTTQGLCFVPDTGRSEIYFGWIDKKYKYEPKMKMGQYTIPTIPFNTRAI